MKKRTICAAIILICTLPFIAQAQAPIKALKNGDKVPDVVIKNILNYKSREAKISDFKGKLLILDFWNKYCASCISGFPKMQALQNQFPEKIQVILVTKDKVESLKSLFKTSVNLKITKLPLVVGDSVLSELFPYRGVPHHVWIDENGVAKAAGYGFTNEENIRNFLARKVLSLPYRLPYQDFDPKRSLLMEGNSRQLKNLRYYSFFMGRLDGTEMGLTGKEFLSDSLNGNPIRGIQTYNLSIIQHIEKAFNFYISGHSDNHIILRVKDPIAYQWPTSSTINVDDWKSQNLYSYGLYIPNANDDEMKAVMREDLKRYFRIDVLIEKRKMKSRILVRTDSVDFIGTKRGDLRNAFEEFTKDGFVLKKNQFATFFSYLKQANVDLKNPNSLPFVDDTGFSPVKLIDLDIKAKINDLPALKKELNRYGLDIVEEEREVNVMIIKEKDYHE